MDRIDLIASLAKDSNCVVDCGCDHAYTLIKALKDYNVKSGIASDLNDMPLENAKENIIKANLENSIEIVKSDGFKNIDSKFDTAIISGMGGILIKNILEESISKLKNKKLIIGAQSDAYIVRRYLTNNNFIITDEYAIVDGGKYYEIMVFEKGNYAYPGYALKYGPILLKKKEEAYVKHYENELKKLEEYLPSIKDTILKDEKLVLRNEYLKILVGDGKQMISILNTDNYYREYFVRDDVSPLIVIAAGGGYKYTSPRESEPVAKFYNDFGFNVVIVNYRETLDLYPMPQKYLAEVIRIYNKDKRVSKIIGLGFSAGGHNILEVALHQDIYKCKIDLLMLGYPVVTAKEEYAHKGSFVNLIGNYTDEVLLKRLSLENEVNENAPDLFLWGTYTDESVPLMNSLLLIEAYKKNNCNCEYHMFPMGGHGLSLANKESSGGDKNKEIPYINKWAELSIAWLKLKLA
ncbi:MAG: tRNA (adenine(22)-N(1))-methyltransferase TrmK [Acholeplasmatales bacterium]|nr:tRNA (adenine(22)-N(1))-methyltransferase TrmK [Acholeplasmatales bacterium]